MGAKTLEQVVAYVSPDLKRQMEEERKVASPRLSMSAYIESVLRRHCEKKRKAA